MRVPDLQIKIHVFRPQKGEMVACQFSSDNQWYRAEVIDVKVSKSKAKVKYVDFGNGEIVQFDRVRHLPQEFATVPIQGKMRFL